MALHGLANYSDLVDRSQSEPAWFWDAVVDFLGIPFDIPYEVVLDASKGPEWATWFTEGRINLANVCVDRWLAEAPDRLAVISERESGGEPRTFTYQELADTVALTSGALAQLGVGKGDTVAVYLPMSYEAVTSMLAVARLGAVFVPIFSGFGPEAVATRLMDAKPTAIITADGFHRRGKLVEMKETCDQAVSMAGHDRGERPACVVVRYADRADTPMDPRFDRWWDEVLATASPGPAAATSAEDPVLVAYTSGTTGRPKGVVHVHGGLTVKLVQEGAFQLDLQPGDVHMWLTDMGWIMGPWMVVAGLGNGATIATYDGAPDYPDPGRVWALVEKLGITALGVSPTLVRALQPHGATYAKRRDLSSLRAFGSTGEPWNPDPWWWLFETIGGSEVPIVNISGGTEVGACFLSVNLLQGLKPCSLGGPALGLAVDVFDEAGRPLRNGVGELVCTSPWPAMTRGFWHDPDRYLETYWQRWPGIWVHGDWASIDHDGFWYLHGRSDDTLNVAGKRIGPAEIESAAVSHPDVVSAAAIGIPHPVKGESVVVYVVPTGDVDSEPLGASVMETVTDHLGKAFRPARVVVVGDLPRTRSAKIMRRVIKARALDRDLGDLAGLENPDSLALIEPLEDEL